MAKWTEPNIKDLFATLNRIERVAELIANDKTASTHWNVQRANEIKTLAQIAARIVQEPINNGE
jgi:5,10-methenyltetrahydromethanopterin hydrogenase